MGEIIECRQICRIGTLLHRRCGGPGENPRLTGKRHFVRLGKLYDGVGFAFINRRIPAKFSTGSKRYDVLGQLQIRSTQR